MSSNNNFSQSPNHFMVLDAISRGMKKIDSIAKVTKLSKDEVELIANDLRNQKLINAVVKKGFFGNKKTEFHISETGMKLLDSKKQELSHTSQRLQQLYETGNRGQMQSMMDDNRSWANEYGNVWIYDGLYGNGNEPSGKCSNRRASR